jgi:indolepyruvate ferredoxin oxidoreductase beta subunit
MIINCLITGVGGQGTVLVSRLIGAAAIAGGLDVRGCETIGMAQRGGSVVSHIRMGTNIHSPLIPHGKADVIIAFEPGEAVRVLPFLAPAGRMIVLDRGVIPVSDALSGGAYSPAAMIAFLRADFDRPREDAVPTALPSPAAEGERLMVCNGEDLIRKCGAAKVLNTALLGIAAREKFFPFTAADLLAVLREKIPAKYLDLNIKAFSLSGK